MSLTVTTDVFCDGPDACLNWTEGTTGSRVDAKGARIRAKAAGWTTRKVDGKLLDLCPGCAALDVEALRG